METGGDPERFWNITLREALRELRALGKARQHQHEREAWLAWHIGVLGRIDKFPSFEDFVKPSTPRAARRRSWEEMHADVLAYVQKGKPQ